ncbi:uncharacterized protein CTHT_0025020 [Thermochaetoides thermophila DSM 1495]|uniref:Ribosomal RNA-processing protein 15 n=1 Tax=Chaetomium thermophilum (strain DSM 1495 / CBS 144.50 / IMI 039719) TaxID=759272 RepID=G0S5P7_CHATD|nr:hypothetical protein CTHT_0025020 [Thermochaetoides thermophila DSM 1495]EGS20666.1 hypothetical protein CTHT_0025020 [Thermochaetoides thermophila DSM 1495]8I9R_Ch Chain Ch, Ribosomal RNA-processing protein 15 [Thermochaetoides thermophila DSM 1495]8I9T_Ch Chain Ch, Ribosomal RNA-processing protein 15 [Thermochaetoides thermophila DSM 1495]
MAGSVKKRSLSDGLKGRVAPPPKKQKKMEYRSSSEKSDSSSDDGGVPLPPNLLDSDDEDFDNIEVDDGATTASSSDDDSDSDSFSESEPKPKKSAKSSKQAPKPPKKDDKNFVAKDAPSSEESDFSEYGSDHDDDSDEEGENDEYSDLSDADTHASSVAGSATSSKSGQHKKSKRNDPDAFAESMKKMLSSKLPASKRADPIVARSAAAAEHARQAADAALEAKARKRLREQKRLALEKGRVRDVLVASTTRTFNVETGKVEEVVDEEGVTTEQIIERERKLRKIAQRGVVKLFNAVRAAQLKALEAEKAARREGVIGSKQKEEKVTEMSRKGFLDLIASGGGGLKKGALEEAR